MKKYCLFLFSLFFNTIFCQHIQVEDNYTVGQLVENILINSSCASVSNITVKGAGFNDKSPSYGYFSKGNSNFPFSDGVVLTTGKARSAPGPNLSPPPLSEGDSSWIGDSDLEKALQISNSYNATIIEFDFIPVANKMSFDYIFASEQYLRNQDSGSCAYTDGFAFLIKEKSSTTPYENLSIIPETNTPVKSNTVVGSGGRCPAINQQYFGQYNYDDSAVAYNGQTSILTAKSNVIPGVIYHIKLVIADQGNPLYDSAIFLKGGSFKVETDLGEDRLLSKRNPLCETEILTLKAPVNASSVQWYKNGGSISGATHSTFTITSISGSGTYSVEVTFSNTSCTSTGGIRVEYASLPIVKSVTMEGCDYDTDGKNFFNLNKTKSRIVLNMDEYEILFYTKNPETDPTAVLITNPSNYQNSVNSETVFAKVINEYGCSNVAEVQLNTNSISISNTEVLSECDVEGKETAVFELKSYYPNIEFFSSLSELELGDYPLPFSFTSANTTVYGLIYDGSRCGKIIQVNLTVLPYAGVNISGEITVCLGDILPEKPLSLHAISGYSYLWNTGEISSSISIAKIGTYSVQIFNKEGCSFTQTFEVNYSVVPKIIEIKVEGSTLEAITDIKGNFEFSLDEILWQNSPVFTQLSSGMYTIYVRTLNSMCFGESKQAVIFFIPNFFSPNGDGVNDLWNISGFDIYPEAVIKIFNRYGGLLVDEKPKEKPFEWNGKYNGKRLIQDSYWYVIKLNNQFTLTGWVFLRNYEEIH